MIQAGGGAGVIFEGGDDDGDIADCVGMVVLMEPEKTTPRSDSKTERIIIMLRLSNLLYKLFHATFGPYLVISYV